MDSKRDTRYVSIIAREFRTALGLSVSTPVKVAFDAEAENITVTLPSGLYRMEIGSDDDEFSFRRLTHADGVTDYVSFPFPPDWIALEEG